MSGPLSGCAMVTLPFERGFKLRSGTYRGPESILNELAWLDTWELLLQRDPFAEVPRTTVAAHDASVADVRIQSRIAELAIANLLASSAFPVCLGGDRIVSLGPVRAAAAGGSIGLVSLSAHADLCNMHDNDYWHSHCTLRRLLDYDCRAMAVGVRNVRDEELSPIRQGRARVVTAREMMAANSWYSFVAELPERIYLSIDMSLFDPSEVPSSARPVAGGPPWSMVLEFLGWLFLNRNVVAADIVELAPGPGDAASLRAAARLVSQIVGLRFS